MKCEIYLYEKGRSKKWKLDIPENIQLNITYSFSSLTSPTTIADNYSKTITLPGTANNNKIFGYIYKFEREITNASDILGVNYNPSKRVSYDLVVNDILYQSGWMKLNKITQQLGDIKYEITLYGDISNFLYKLSNGDVDDAENKLLYSLSFPNNLSHQISKDTLKSFIDNSNSLAGYMTYIRANNGLYDEFESSKHLTKDASGNYVVTDILDGLEFDELQKRECRSYYQRPALSVKGIFDRIKHDETEFQLNLDESFFKDSNPYYSKSYMTLPLLSQYESSESVIGTNRNNYRNQANSAQVIIYEDDEDGIFYNSYINLGKIPGNKDIILEYEVGLYTEITDASYSAITTEYRRFIPVPGIDGGAFNTMGIFKPVGSSEGFPIYDFREQIYSLGNPTFRVIGRSGWCRWDLSNVYPLYKNASEVRYFPVRNYLIYGNTVMEMNNARGQISIVMYVPTKLYCVELSKYFTATTTVYIRPITKAPSGNVNLNNYYPASYGFTGKDITIVAKQAVRSYYEINKGNLLDKETTQSQFLIDYAKLFGLIFDTDKKGNITLKTRNKYFEDYKILDWSNKLDYNQPIETNPLSFDTRYLTFKYGNSGGKYEDLHYNKYGIDYGELKINTGYQFNNDSKSIFEPIFQNTVISKEIDRFIVNNATVIERNSELEIPAYFSRGESNREAIDTKFNLLFDNGIKSLTGNDTYWLSDDTSMYMLNEDIGGGEYCWLDCNNTTNLQVTLPMNYYRQFSTLYNEGNTICSFDIRRPRENYAKWNSVTYPNNVDIYSQFWQNYLNEIYNVNTKEISAYFKLSFNDMNTFSFKNFIVIGDALFHPIKIENYNPLANSTTKVTLVKVNDINNYIAGQIVPEITVNYFNVTESFAYACTLNMPSQVAEGGTFICNIRKKDPLGHIVVDDCELSMGGITLNAADYIDTETETVTIPNVTGDIVIGISCSQIIAGGDDDDPDIPIKPIDPSTGGGGNNEDPSVFATSVLTVPGANSNVARLYTIGGSTKLDDLGKGLTSIHTVESVAVDASGAHLTVPADYMEWIYGLGDSAYIFVYYDNPTSGSKENYYAPISARYDDIPNGTTFTLLKELNLEK